MENQNLLNELNKMRDLLSSLENELKSIDKEEADILEFMQKSGLDSASSDIISESIKLQENISKLLKEK